MIVSRFPHRCISSVVAVHYDSGARKTTVDCPEGEYTEWFYNTLHQVTLHQLYDKQKNRYYETQYAINPKDISLLQQDPMATQIATRIDPPTAGFKYTNIFLLVQTMADPPRVFMIQQDK